MEAKKKRISEFLATLPMNSVLEDTQSVMLSPGIDLVGGDYGINGKTNNFTNCLSCTNEANCQGVSNGGDCRNMDGGCAGSTNGGSCYNEVGFKPVGPNMGC